MEESLQRGLAGEINLNWNVCETLRNNEKERNKKRS